jgi:hypothetical protein
MRAVPRTRNPLQPHAAQPSELKPSLAVARRTSCSPSLGTLPSGAQAAARSVDDLREQRGIVHARWFADLDRLVTRASARVPSRLRWLAYDDADDACVAGDTCDAHAISGNRGGVHRGSSHVERAHLPAAEPLVPIARSGSEQAFARESIAGHAVERSTERARSLRETRSGLAHVMIGAPRKRAIVSTDPGDVSSVRNVVGVTPLGGGEARVLPSRNGT